MNNIDRSNYIYEEPPTGGGTVPFPPRRKRPTSDVEPPSYADESTGPRPFTEDAFREAAGEPSKEDNLRAQLIERAFNYALAPLPPYPILRLGDRTISTPGNLSSIQGPVKSGKTGVLEAMLAAVLNGNRQGPDTLGFSAENINGKAVIHFDTEQSRYDHDSLIRRSMRRARIEMPPPWFYSYNLTDLTVTQRREALEVVLGDACAIHGGIFLVIIDGIADLCASPNDEEGAYELVGRLHTLAIQHDCAIVCVLHENPGSEGGKMRGHLGSQLERKAETPLRLAKDASSGVTTIWSDRARHCHLPRNQGICFAWSDEAKMHVSVGTVPVIKANAKSAKFRDEAEKAFGDAEFLTYTELVARLMEAVGDGIAETTAEKRVSAYVADGILIKTQTGKYALK